LQTKRDHRAPHAKTDSDENFGPPYALRPKTYSSHIRQAGLLTRSGRTVFPPEGSDHEIVRRFGGAYSYGDSP